MGSRVSFEEKLPSLLNEAQLEAVTAPAGPLLVVAGAGTGKTRVITYRVAYLISKGAPQHRVLAVTFTNKAAREMKDRIQNEVECPDVWVSTFHSFAARVLRHEGQRLGYTSDFSIYDEDDSKSVIRDIALEISLKEKLEDLSPDDARKEISRLKNSLISPDEMNVVDMRTRLIAETYHKYDEALRSQNAMDFDDLLLNLMKLLENDNDVRDHYQQRFDAILVDEYQDTNSAQGRIVDIMSEKHLNLTVTGDPDQSIYSWRGARLQNILDFQKKYSNACVVRLERNYRSTPNIVAAADTVIRNNQKRLERALYTKTPEGKPVTVAVVDEEMAEARWVIEHIVSEVRLKKGTYNDYAVLYRTNFQSRAFETICLDYQVPYVVVGGQAFFERQEVRDVISYMRLIVNPLDEAAFRRAMLRPSRGVGEKTVDSIIAAARSNKSDLLSTIRKLGGEYKLPSRQADGAFAFLEMMEDLRKMPLTPVAPIVKAVIEGSGFKMYWQEKGEEERNENIDELLNAAAQYDEDNPESSLRGFLDMVSLVTDQDRISDQETQGRLVLMTLHAAKGLEFPVVFLTGLVEGSLPHSRSITSESGPDALEEERRLCYVGMTRARRELYLTTSGARRVGGGIMRVLPSRFLDELPKDGIEWEDTRSMREFSAKGAHSWDEVGMGAWDRTTKSGRGKGKPSSWSAKWRDESPKSVEKQRDAIERVYDEAFSAEAGFKSGDKVRHAVFGTGVVEKAGTDHVVVNFQQVGRKRLALSFAKLEKLG